MLHYNWTKRLKKTCENYRIKSEYGRMFKHIELAFGNTYLQVIFCPLQYRTTKTTMNNMWILRNSSCLLGSLDQLDVRTATSVQTCDFSILYTSILHKLLKFRETALVHNSFKKRDGCTRYTHIKASQGKEYFVNSINGTTWTQGCLFSEVIEIFIGTNCAPLPPDLFLYS